MYVYS